MNIKQKQTLQKVFNKSVKRVLAQGKKSLRKYNDCGYSTTQCAYRGNNNTRCAIGHLLTNKQMAKYKIKEGFIVRKFPNALIRELVPGINVDNAMYFLVRLQECHDHCSKKNFRESFKLSCNKIAEDYELEPV